MTPKLLSTVLLLAITHNSYCQIKDSANKYNKNVFLVEVFGHSRSLISGNYEYIFHPSRVKLLSFTARAGVGYVPGSRESNTKGIAYFPLSVGVLVGKGKHYASFKMGCTPSIGWDKIDTALMHQPQNPKNETAWIVSASYRFMQYKEFTIEAIPIQLVWTNNPNQRFSWSFGLSMGSAF